MAKKLSAKAFDASFDAGESIVDQLDLTTANRPGLTPQRINVDFPAWEVEALDREADRLGIARQSLIKVWIAERLDAMQSERLRNN
jgi:hypothetical protein